MADLSKVGSIAEAEVWFKEHGEGDGEPVLTCENGDKSQAVATLAEAAKFYEVEE